MKLTLSLLNALLVLEGSAGTTLRSLRGHSADSTSLQAAATDPPTTQFYADNNPCYSTCPHKPKDCTEFIAMTTTIEGCAKSCSPAEVEPFLPPGGCATGVSIGPIGALIGDIVKFTEDSKKSVVINVVCALSSPQPPQLPRSPHTLHDG